MPTRSAVRRATRVPALVAAGLLLAGCGSDSGETDSATARGGPSDAFPGAIPTAFGDVTVEEEPTRVIALGWSDAETALALGVQPVGASDWLPRGGNGVGGGGGGGGAEEPGERA